MGAKCRVLHILTCMLPTGGAERNTIYAIQGLTRMQYQVDLVVGKESDLTWDLAEGIKITKLNELVREIDPVLDLKGSILIIPHYSSYGTKDTV